MPAANPVKLLLTRLIHLLLYVMLLLLLLPGCGKKGGDNPAVPGTSLENETTSGPSITGTVGYPTPDPGTSGNKAMFGYCEISWDEEDGFTVVPLRGVDYTFNINIFIQPPLGDPATFKIEMINMEKLLITGECEVELSLTHPFPNMEVFTAFDLLGVIITTGAYEAGSNTDIIYANPAYDPILKNADGYTRWFNQMEFPIEGILGFTEGILGNKGEAWGATINPYKYFAHNLFPTGDISSYFQSGTNVSNRGAFFVSDTLSRNYKLDFPIVYGKLDVRFQYAFIVSWAVPANDPPIHIPGDFPADANMQEAFYCNISTAGSTLFWHHMYDRGGELKLTLEIYDWQEMSGEPSILGEIHSIVLDSPDEFINGGTKLVFYPGEWSEFDGSAPHSVKLILDIGKVVPQGPCPYDNDVLITIVTSEQGDYSNGLYGEYPEYGILSGYARLFYDMGNICNNPPTVEFTNCPEDVLEVKNTTMLWIGEDDVTPNKLLEYRWKLDDGVWSDWEVDRMVAHLENLTEEQHTVYVQCRDHDGQVTEESCTFFVSVPPLSNPPSVSFANCVPYIGSSWYTWHLNVSDDNTPLSQMKVRFNFDSAGWVELPVGSMSITLNGLTSGTPHQLIVEVEDGDGYKDQAICNFSVNFAPTVTIENCPDQDLNADNIVFTWFGGDPDLDTLTYETKLDVGAWIDRGTDTSLALTGLSSGNHVFYVRVQDPLGETDQDQCNFKVNLAPTVSITNCPVADVNETAYSFNWTAGDDLDSPLTLEYNLGLDGVWQGWQVGISSYLWTPLTSGPRLFSVQVRDSGNPQLVAEDFCMFSVNFAPDVTIDNCPVNYILVDHYLFTWTGIDDLDSGLTLSYSYKLDSNPWSPWVADMTSVNLTGLSDGWHTIDVAIQDQGNPPLTCHGPPDVCATCTFEVNTAAASFPGIVPNFQASDADMLIVTDRTVELTWSDSSGVVDFYDIERYDYTWGVGWGWTAVVSIPGANPNLYLDTNARYSGYTNPIDYRIKARNTAGSSGWSTDTGYPKMRNIWLAFWCALDDSGNPATTWPRAAADFLDTNTFWNQYGFNFELATGNNFDWVTNPAYFNLSGSEYLDMHRKYGYNYPDAINVYFVNECYSGQTWGAFCRVLCPGFFHNTSNLVIVQGSTTRGFPPNEYEIVLAHELGHGMARLWDTYLLDRLGNNDRRYDPSDGTSCATTNTWCTGPPPDLPPLFCDEKACYPFPPGAAGKIPKALMWYSFPTPATDYDLWETQYIWVDEWISGNEGNYPYP